MDVKAFQDSYLRRNWSWARETELAREAERRGVTDLGARGAGEGEEQHLFTHAGGGGRCVKVMTIVGSPKRRPRCSGAKITGGAHKIPLVEHEKLVEREGGKVTAFVGVGVSANDAVERPGGNKNA